MPVHTKPAEGLPTPFSIAEEAAYSTLFSTQLQDVRKTAENWRNGLAAMTGLIAAFSVIKGPSDIAGLTHDVAYGVGILLFLALCSAAVGVWSSLVAAYGEPDVTTREQFLKLGGIEGYRLTKATLAIKKLKCAQGATIVTLLLLTFAVALTWYGPRSASATLDVERRSLPNVCGKLVSSSNGNIDVKPSDSMAVRLALTDVIKLTFVEKCP
jgi:hypothetical protein